MLIGYIYTIHTHTYIYIYIYTHTYITVLGSSAGKESACNVGDPNLIPGLGQSPGEGIGYPFQYYWASLVAQMVKNPPIIWETWVQSMGLEDLLGEGMATQSNILAWRIAMDRGAWKATVRGLQRFGHD